MMTKLKTKQKTAFRVFYEQLEKTSKVDLMDEIVATLDLSQKTIYRRLDNPSFFSSLEKAAIANLAKKPVEELFPESEKK